MNYYFTALAIISLISFGLANQCVDPKFSDFKTYVTRDSKIHSETSFVVEFRLQCSNYAKNVPLYTEINGNLLASSSNDDKYEFSWTENHKSARTGDYVVRVYDEDGFSELKRAQRNNEDISKVKEIAKTNFNFSGPTKGPLVQYELVVFALFGAIFYWAFSVRSQIQS